MRVFCRRLYGVLIGSLLFVFSNLAGAVPVTYTNFIDFQNDLSDPLFVETFEGYPAGQLIPNNIQQGAIRYSYPELSTLLTLMVDDSEIALSGNNYLSTNGGPFLGGDDINFEFTQSSAFGLFFLTVDFLFDSDLILEAAGATARQSKFGTVSTLPDGTDVYFLGIIDNENPFTEAKLTSFDGEFFVFDIDDIVLANVPATVDEPASFVLLLAILGITLFRKFVSGTKRGLQRVNQGIAGTVTGCVALVFFHSSGAVAQAALSTETEGIQHSHVHSRACPHFVRTPRTRDRSAPFVVVSNATCGLFEISCTKEISNVVYRSEGGDTKLEPINDYRYSLIAEDVSDIWVRCGNNASGDGPDYGQRFLVDDSALCEPEPEMCVDSSDCPNTLSCGEGGLCTTIVGGRLFEDSDGDGRFGPGDTPVTRALVRLQVLLGPDDWAMIAADLPDGSGFYSFTGINSTFTTRVLVEPFPGDPALVFTLQNAFGVSDTVDSDVDADGFSDAITLPPDTIEVSIWAGVLR